MQPDLQIAYPSGLCGLLALGGTRRAFMVAQNRGNLDPGRIDYAAYTQFVLDRYLDILKDFFELGGSVAVMRLMSRTIYTERGEDYAKMALRYTSMLAGEQAVNTYATLGCGVAFAGLGDVESRDRNLAARLQAVERPGPRTVVWEVGTPDGPNEPTLPPPDFYLGSNQSGDLKIRFPMPTMPRSGQPLRLFFTPYPSLLLTRRTLENIFEALVSPKTHRSLSYDWRGRYTSEEAEAQFAEITRQAEQGIVFGV